jgi:50S ribosomal subunit-associated GTPase HflX
MDGGHAHNLDRLQSQKGTVLKALEKLESRRAEILYTSGSRGSQLKRMKRRINVRIKWRRRSGKLCYPTSSEKVVARMTELRADADARRQAEYLDVAYEKRLAEAVAYSEFTDEESAPGTLWKMFLQMNGGTTSI